MIVLGHESKSHRDINLKVPTGPFVKKDKQDSQKAAGRPRNSRSFSISWRPLFSFFSGRVRADCMHVRFDSIDTLHTQRGGLVFMYRTSLMMMMISS